TSATGPRRISTQGTVVGYASGFVFVWKNGTQAQKINQISANAPAMYMALNDNDQVISTYDVSSGGLTVPHGCVFEKNSSGAWMTTPEDLPPLAGDNASQAHAINNNGLVVGSSFVFTLDANGNPVYGTVQNPMHLVAWQKDQAGAWQVSAIPDTTTGAVGYSVT